jgi:hypothetical protein
VISARDFQREHRALQKGFYGNRNASMFLAERIPAGMEMAELIGRAKNAL